ncbi:DUF2975 domain-containing protein [Marinovum sp. 2_MG-2023]|uniref:DUF2975 domain-containing protein n=1 Tax=unclassified Marinovum TaxID=2647166 RepID=UPI0026E23739|nr:MULTISPECIES: DUF2975 domain-containing protein [unclassified Marinovum]MDO6729672.1 DUF2975 domain-containing protein [Marinovum sp. 2_MG-2023]MDO6779486.1 DUF2975 domain-containing protein [Marinovum sp. 1_MG-2023]
MRDHNRLRRWAGGLHVLAILAMVLLAVVVALGLFLVELSDELRLAAGLDPALVLDGSRGFWVRLAGIIPLAALFYVLFQMAALFRRYAAGEFLTDRCADHILRIGVGLLVAVVLDMLCRPLQILLASLANPPGQRVLALSLEGADLGQVLAGGLMIVIGWTMHDAARAAEENRGFV